MVDQELTDYIESMKDSGFSEEETRKKLLDAGWDAGDVDGALGITPEPAAVPVPRSTAPSGMAYQGIGIRFAAQIVDTIILLIIYFIISFILGMFLGIFVMNMMGGGYYYGGLQLLFYIIFIGLWFGYFVFMEGSKGQTVGKMVCGIKVVKEDGSPCDMHAALIRNLLRIVDSLPFAYIVGVILISGSDKKQRLGDKSAHTVVVKA